VRGLPTALERVHGRVYTVLWAGESGREPAHAMGCKLWLSPESLSRRRHVSGIFVRAGQMRLSCPSGPRNPVSAGECP
jgi:hypothetical protein